MCGRDRRSETRAYHLQEFRTANDPQDPRRIVPVIPEECTRILDIGCGAGQTLSACAPGSEAFCYGLDIDQYALELGRELVPRVRFVRGVGECLPFRTEEFHFVLARVALPYMNIPVVLAEVMRVLKPAGKFWATLHSYTMMRKDLLRSAREFQLKNVFFRLYVLMNGLCFHFSGKLVRFPVGGGRYESFQTERGIRCALLAAGFDDVGICRDRFFVVTARKPQGFQSTKSTE